MPAVLPGAVLGRCVVRGCPVRYRTGPDRLCDGHRRADTITEEEWRADQVAARQAAADPAFIPGVSATGPAADPPARDGILPTSETAKRRARRV